MASATVSPNKQFERTVIRRHVRAACASLHYAHAARWTPFHAAAELRRQPQQRGVPTNLTLSSIRTFVETAVGWIDIAMLVAGLAVCAFLSKAVLMPAPEDRHGGVFELIGVVLLIPAMAGAFVAWLSMRRRARWRWWVQPVPFVTFYAVAFLFDAALLDSAWQAILVVAVTWVAALSYACFGRRSAG